MCSQTTDCDVGCLWDSKEKAVRTQKARGHRGTQRTQKDTEDTENPEDQKESLRAHLATTLAWGLAKPREDARKSSREKAMLSMMSRAPAKHSQLCPCSSVSTRALSSCPPSFHFFLYLFVFRQRSPNKGELSLQGMFAP